MAALRSSTGRTSPWSGLSPGVPDVPEAPRGEVNAPSSRALHVWGLLLPLPAGEVMPDSGYRCHQGAPNRPTAAGDRRDAGYGCGPANPERALSSAG